MVMLVTLTEDDDAADNVGQCWSIIVIKLNQMNKQLKETVPVIYSVYSTPENISLSDKARVRACDRENKMPIRRYICTGTEESHYHQQHCRRGGGGETKSSSFSCMPRLPGKKNVLFDNLKIDHLIRVSKMLPSEISFFLIYPPCEKPETQNLIARHVLAFHADLLRSSSRVPAPQTFGWRLWVRNAWRTPKKVCVEGLACVRMVQNKKEKEE